MTAEPISHRDARVLVCEGFRRLFAREPTRSLAQFAQAVCLHETGYGQLSPFGGSNNWGAVQAGRSWAGATIDAHDTSPIDGSNASRAYPIKFRAYPAPIDGCVDALRSIFRDRGVSPPALEAASKADALGFSTALYGVPGRRYYEGFGPDDEARIGHHVEAIRRALVTICRALGESLPDGTEVGPLPLRRGSTGPAVEAVQRIVGAVPDGRFGPKTEALVMVWQRLHGLKADGIWGDKSRAKAKELGL